MNGPVHWGEHLMMMMIIVMAKVGLMIPLRRWYARRQNIIYPAFLPSSSSRCFSFFDVINVFFLLKLALYLKVDNTETWKYRFSVICESKT